jgi:hypothetical protein
MCQVGHNKQILIMTHGSEYLKIIFLIYLESVFHNWNKKCTNMGLPIGYQTIHHLHFADDQITIALARDKEDAECMIKKIMEEYPI